MIRSVLDHLSRHVAPNGLGSSIAITTVAPSQAVAEAYALRTVGWILHEKDPRDVNRDPVNGNTQRRRLRGARSPAESSPCARAAARGGYLDDDMVCLTYNHAGADDDGRTLTS